MERAADMRVMKILDKLAASQKLSMGGLGYSGGLSKLRKADELEDLGMIRKIRAGNLRGSNLKGSAFKGRIRDPKGKGFSGGLLSYSDLEKLNKYVDNVYYAIKEEDKEKLSKYLDKISKFNEKLKNIRMERSQSSSILNKKDQMIFDKLIEKLKSKGDMIRMGDLNDFLIEQGEEKEKAKQKRLKSRAKKEILV